MAEKKKNINQLTSCFWELSRPRQDSFLRELYNLSKQNQSLFQMRLGKNDAFVMQTLILEIEKQTIHRIGKFRKLRLSKINEALRNADKYALNMSQQTKLKRVAAFGMIEFVTAGSYMPERYIRAAARHLDEYLHMVQLHILEKSEQEEIYQREKEIIRTILSHSDFFPVIEDVYLKYFA